MARQLMGTSITLRSTPNPILLMPRPATLFWPLVEMVWEEPAWSPGRAVQLSRRVETVAQPAVAAAVQVAFWLLRADNSVVSAGTPAEEVTAVGVR